MQFRIPLKLALLPAPLLFASLLPALVVLAPLAASAQDAAETPTGPIDGAAGLSLSQALATSGPAVWICAVLAVLAFYFAVEGFFKFRAAALAPPEELARLRELLHYGHYQEAWRTCAAGRSFLCVVAGAGLERVGRGADAVEFALTEASFRQAAVLKTSLNYLSVIGVVAPMIGLTGTVLGMIRAFEVLGDPRALAGAIGHVLTATAAGLLAAIPGFAFYYLFKSKAQTAILLADDAIYRLFEHLPYEALAGGMVGPEAEGLAEIEATQAPEESEG